MDGSRSIRRLLGNQGTIAPFLDAAPHIVVDALRQLLRESSDPDIDRNIARHVETLIRLRASSWQTTLSSSCSKSSYQEPMANISRGTSNMMTCSASAATSSAASADATGAAPT